MFRVATDDMRLYRIESISTSPEFINNKMPRSRLCVIYILASEYFIWNFCGRQPAYKYSTSAGYRISKSKGNIS